ncbi:hypothetical protein [Polyangium aurulentum]|uniref:hypothetical protein n=1 Tax=Polyangium aurulentum TaxID=2567896 RepID=UPI0010ADF415|nr:hypothetical protein [Polyangium aurulentum]UQA55733.1 hypothetical protein E8A73_030920 [Polyangium aurulentum]
MPAAPNSSFEEGVSRALASIGAAASDLALDALAAPAAVTAALGRMDAGEPFLLRVAPPLGQGNATHGPPPAPPLWVRASFGSPSLRTAPLFLDQAASPATPRAARVLLEQTDVPCCDAPSCTGRRSLASAWLVLDGKMPAGHPPRLLVAEAADLDAARALARVQPVAAALARALEIPLAPEDAAEPAPQSTQEALPAESLLPARALARFAMRSEGDRLVLRDHGSTGSRAAARNKAILGLVILGVALVLWIQTVRAFQGGDRNLMLGAGSAALLLTVASYGFLGVARFASRYAARSVPVLWAGRDRFVIAPWVSHEGAVDRLPEGRLGAAIALEELRGVVVCRRDALAAIEIDTDHGPMDALTLEDEAVARFFAEPIRRALADMAHPSTRASARKRLREKSAARAGG